MHSLGRHVVVILNLKYASYNLIAIMYRSELREQLTWIRVRTTDIVENVFNTYDASCNFYRWQRECKR